MEDFVFVYLFFSLICFLFQPQQANTCSKSTVETVEQGETDAQS